MKPAAENRHSRCKNQFMERYHRRNVCASLRMHRPTYKAGCLSNIPRRVAKPYPKWVLWVQPTSPRRRIAAPGKDAAVSSADRRSKLRWTVLSLVLSLDKQRKDNKDTRRASSRRKDFRWTKRTEQFRWARSRKKDFRWTRSRKKDFRWTRSRKKF